MKEIFNTLNIDKDDFENILLDDIQKDFVRLDRVVFEIESKELDKLDGDLENIKDYIKERREKYIRPDDLTYKVIEENLEYFIKFFIHADYSVCCDEDGMIDIPVGIMEKLFIVLLFKADYFYQYTDIYKQYVEYFTEVEKRVCNYLNDELMENILIESATTSNDFYILSGLDIKRSKEMYKKADELAKTYHELKWIGKTDEAEKVKDILDWYNEIIDPMKDDYNLLYSSSDYEIEVNEFKEGFSIEFIMDLASYFDINDCSIGYVGDETCEVRKEEGIEFNKQWRYRLVGLAISLAKSQDDIDLILSYKEEIIGEYLDDNIDEIEKVTIEEMKEIISLEISPKSIDYSEVSQVSHDIAFEIFDKGYTWLYSKMIQHHDDLTITNKAVRRDGNALQYASWRLKDDDHIVATAVRNKPEALQFASARCRSIKEFVLPIIEKQPSLFRYISDDLKDDKEIVTIALEDDDWCNINYEKIGDDLKDDEDLYNLAIEKNIYNFQNASDKFKSDKTEVLKIIKKCPDMFTYISYNLKYDKDVLEVMYKEVDKIALDIYLKIIKK